MNQPLTLAAARRHRHERATNLLCWRASGADEWM
jgi:hypothetical protein